MRRRRRPAKIRLSWKSIGALFCLALVASFPAQSLALATTCVALALCVYLFRQIESKKEAQIAESREQARLSEIAQARLDVIDEMAGDQFEDYIAGLLSILGYQTEVTKRSRDGGADVIAVMNAERIAIQTKRYSGVVGIKAVQEADSGKVMYNCNKSMVISNRSYSKDAIELAAKSGCILIDRDGLADLILQARKKLCC
jgi:HJR/Mrr/RecB family endonuclease